MYARCATRHSVWPHERSELREPASGWLLTNPTFRHVC